MAFHLGWVLATGWIVTLVCMLSSGGRGFSGYRNDIASALQSMSFSSSAPSSAPSQSQPSVSMSSFANSRCNIPTDAGWPVGVYFDNSCFLRGVGKAGCIGTTGCRLCLAQAFNVGAGGRRLLLGDEIMSLPLCSVVQQSKEVILPANLPTLLQGSKPEAADDLSVAEEAKEAKLAAAAAVASTSAGSVEEDSRETKESDPTRSVVSVLAEVEAQAGPFEEEAFVAGLVDALEIESVATNDIVVDSVVLGGNSGRLEEERVDVLWEVEFQIHVPPETENSLRILINGELADTEEEEDLDSVSDVRRQSKLLSSMHHRGFLVYRVVMSAEAAADRKEEAAAAAASAELGNVQAVEGVEVLEEDKAGVSGKETATTTTTTSKASGAQNPADADVSDVSDGSSSSSSSKKEKESRLRGTTSSTSSIGVSLGGGDEVARSSALNSISASVERSAGEGGLAGETSFDHASIREEEDDDGDSDGDDVVIDEADPNSRLLDSRQLKR